MNTQNFCFVLKQNSHLLREGCFGLEKENVRVNQDGTLALTPHPAVFGDKETPLYNHRLFGESGGNDNSAAAKCGRGFGIYGNTARCGDGEYRR